MLLPKLTNNSHESQKDSSLLKVVQKKSDSGLGSFCQATESPRVLVRSPEILAARCCQLEYWGASYLVLYNISDFHHAMIFSALRKGTRVELHSCRTTSDRAPMRCELMQPHRVLQLRESCQLASLIDIKQEPEHRSSLQL